jgi:hypothetical protein
MSALPVDGFDVSLVTSNLQSTPAQNTRREPLWPEAVVAVGLGLSAVWTILLGYGLVRLVELVI